MEAEDFDAPAFDDLSLAFESKAVSIAYYLGELKTYADMAKAEAKRITAKAKTAESRIEHLKTYLKGAMEESQVMEVEKGTYKIKIQNSPPMASITNVDKIPAKYKEVRMETVIDKRELLKDLKKGKVAGAELIQNTNLRIY